MKLRLLVVAALAATLLPSVAALAAPKTVALYVRARSANTAEHAALLEELLREQLASLQDVTVAVVDGVPASPGAAVSEQIEAAYRALNDPKLLELPADTVRATIQVPFERAYRDLIAWPGPLDRRLMARTIKGKALAHILLNEAPKAAAAIQDSLTLWPDQRAVEWAYTPDAYRLFTRISEGQGDLRKGAVRIESTPPGAKVSVDGRSRGNAPVTISNLPPGAHWVEVGLDGHARLARFVSVSADETALWEASLTALPSLPRLQELAAGLPGNRTPSKAAAGVEALRALSGADEVIILDLALRKEAYTLTGWHGVAGADGGAILPTRLSAKIPESGGMLGAAQAFVSTTVGSAPAPPATDAEASLGGPAVKSVMGLDGKARDELPDVAETEFYETWWFWTIIGGVVAVGATVAIVLALTGEDDVTAPTGNVAITVNSLP